jgi:hypothetical protein
MTPLYIQIAIDAIEKRDLTVEEFCEIEYGHDQSRHPMEESALLEFWLDGESTAAFFKRLENYE